VLEIAAEQDRYVNPGRLLDHYAEMLNQSKGLDPTLVAVKMQEILNRKGRKGRRKR
jgi:hypothetical protein